MGPNQSHSGCSTTTTMNHSSSCHLIFRHLAFFFSTKAVLPHVVEPPPWQISLGPEPSLIIFLVASDDTKGIPLSGCLARSPTSFYRGVVPLVLVMIMSQHRSWWWLRCGHHFCTGSLGPLASSRLKPIFYWLGLFFIFLYFLYFSLFLFSLSLFYFIFYCHFIFLKLC